MRKLIGLTLMVLILIITSGFLLSPYSYFYVTFEKPLMPGEYLSFLEEYDIDPAEHNVYVLHSQLDRQEGIMKDKLMLESRLVTDTVFNTRLYAIKALFDNRIREWEFAGPRHPYD